MRITKADRERAENKQLLINGFDDVMRLARVAIEYVGETVRLGERALSVALRPKEPEAPRSVEAFWQEVALRGVSLDASSCAAEDAVLRAPVSVNGGDALVLPRRAQGDTFHVARLAFCARYRLEVEDVRLARST